MVDRKESNRKIFNKIKAAGGKVICYRAEKETVEKIKDIQNSVLGAHEQRLAIDHSINLAHSIIFNKK